MLPAALFVLTLLPQATQAAERPFDEAKVVAQVERLAREALAEEGVPGLSILVARGDEVLVSKGYGYADAKRGTPVAEDTRFSIGTLTRTFTATAVLELVEQDKLDLDEHLGELLPRFPTAGHKITVRQLLTDSSGLPSPAKLLARRRAAGSPEDGAPKAAPAKATRKGASGDTPGPEKGPSADGAWRGSDGVAHGPVHATPQRTPGRQPGQGSAPYGWQAGTDQDAGQDKKGQDAERDEPAEDLSEPDPQKKQAEMEALFELFRDVPFDFAPGEGRETDNAGWLVLALIVEKASGEDYGAWLRANVIEPLDLERTDFCPLEGGTRGFADDCLRAADDERLELPTARRLARATSTLCTTARDLHRWQQAIHERALLGEESTRIVLGLARRGDGERKIEENDPAAGTIPWSFASADGEVSGFQSLAAYYPGPRLSIVMLSNCSTAPLARMEASIAREALGLVPPEVAVEDLPLEDAEIARFVGRYQIATTLVRVVERDGKIWMEFPTQAPLRLLYQGRNFFVGDQDRATRVTFQVEGDGPAASFTMLRDGLQSVGKRME